MYTLCEMRFMPDSYILSTIPGTNVRYKNSLCVTCIPKFD